MIIHNITKISVNYCTIMIMVVIIMNNFGKQLKKLRLAHKMSQVNLSVKIGMSQESISSYERGASIPGIDVLDKFSEFFNVSCDYLMGKSDREKNITIGELSSDELYIIKNYRTYSQHDKETFCKMSDCFKRDD